MILNYLQKRIDILRAYSQKGEEQARRALVQIFGLENAKKAYTGQYKGLLDEQLMAKRKQAEEDFRRRVAANPEWQRQFGDAWETMEKVIDLLSKHAKENFYRRILGSQLFGHAQTLVRYAEEIQKPDARRLDGYHDAQLDELKFRLLSPAPIYPDLEEAVLAGLLEMSLEALGREDPFIQTVLAESTPDDVARQLIANTRLVNIEERKALLEGGKKAIERSTDALIVLARNLDPLLREQEEWYRQNIESVMAAASEKIARARFVVYGKSVYPDATFTLRLSFGTVKGYEMNGTLAPYKTTLYGLYDRALSFDQKSDWWLPKRFWERKESLDLSTPVNFVSTCDIIGGNSGSPVINRNAEIVGLIFDGNIESLPGRFMYDETRNRAVAVHTAYIVEALRKLYDAATLADELEGTK